MRRNLFLVSLGSQCGRCAVRALVMTAALIGPAVMPVNSQNSTERVDAAVEVMPASRVPASPLLASRSSGSPRLIDERNYTFAERTVDFRAASRDSRRAGRDDVRDRLTHAAFLPEIERQRTPLQSQVRLPIREFFGGRLELACVHTRMRHVGVHSAVPRSAMGYRLHSPYAASLAPRTRASLTLGFWFRL